MRDELTPDLPGFPEVAYLSCERSHKMSKLTGSNHWEDVIKHCLNVALNLTELYGYA